MSRGYVRRRCSKCGASVKDTTCSNGHNNGRTGNWSFALDVTPVGAAKRTRITTIMVGGKRVGVFNTKKAAEAAMSTIEAAIREGTHVEASRMTTGWVAASIPRFLFTWIRRCGPPSLTMTLSANSRQISRVPSVLSMSTTISSSTNESCSSASRICPTSFLTTIIAESPSRRGDSLDDSDKVRSCFPAFSIRQAL